jgi:hypothetical protein
LTRSTQNIQNFNHGLRYVCQSVQVITSYILKKGKRIFIEFVLGKFCCVLSKSVNIDEIRHNKKIYMTSEMYLYIRNLKLLKNKTYKIHFSPKILFCCKSRILRDNLAIQVTLQCVHVMSVFPQLSQEPNTMSITECLRTIYCLREKYNVRSTLSFEPDFFARF